MRTPPRVKAASLTLHVVTWPLLGFVFTAALVALAVVAALAALWTAAIGDTEGRWFADRTETMFLNLWMRPCEILFRLEDRDG